MSGREVLRQGLEVAARGDWSALSEALGLTPIAAPIDFASDSNSKIGSRIAGVASSLHRVSASDQDAARAALWVATIPEWGDRPAARERARRRSAKALVELAPAGDRNILIVLTSPDSDDIELILPRQRSNGTLGTIRAIVSRTSPNRHHLEMLEALVLSPDMGTAAIARRWSDAFSVERVTDAFYREFRLLRDRFVETLGNSNPDHPLLDPGNDEAKLADLRRFVTRNMGRVLFLWFIQAKGWLNEDSAYLTNLYHRTVATHRNYFIEALLPLFFDTLAVETARRTPKPVDLGKIPYLNGGLFVPTAFEDRLYGEERQRIDIVIPNELFDSRTHDGKQPTLLGLLSSYRFTTQESTPDDLSVDPDPELLGKVFENLLEDRKKTGTFYTPREIVRFMCREALDGFLVERTGVTRETLGRLRLEAIDPEATDTHLSVSERTGLQKALLSVKVCDPAVGSGAFPVGMLQEIVQLLIGIEQSADVHVHVGGQKVAEWKEEVITNCLYGVDINPEAVEICQLRLWLSMVVDAERPVPLPNLDFRFEAGDSLVDRVGKTSLRETLPREASQGAMLFDELGTIESELDDLRSEYTTIRDSVRVRALRSDIKAKQLELVEKLISEKLDGVKQVLSNKNAHIDKLKRAGAGTPDLRKDAQKAAVYVEQIEQLRAALAGLSPDAHYKKPFLWPVEFPEIFEQGGFDIVIANPPYVRQEKLAALDQETYALSFSEVHTGTADLYVYFFARALQLLKDGGHLAFITSNKFHRAAYGEGLRGILPRTLQVEHLIDFGDLAVFGAIAYPAVLIGQKGTPDFEATPSVAQLTHPVRRALVEVGASESVSSVREQLDNLDDLLERNKIEGFPQALLRKEGWVLEDPKLVRLFDRIVAMGTPLGEFVQGRMYRGVLTGLNEAFVIDEAKRAELIAADPRSAEIIKPWLRGRDIKRWKPEWAGLYLIAIQSSSDADCSHPWKNASTEKNARLIFADVYPALHQHMSAFEDRLRPRSDQGRWWWELRSCTYYKEFEQPKVVWGNLAMRSKFSWDEAGAYVGAPSNLLTSPPKWLISVLNSTVLDFVYPWLTVERSGGYQEFKIGYIEGAPIVTPTVEQATRLVSLGSSDPSNTQLELDAIVAEMYGVSESELSCIRSWLYERESISRNLEPSHD